MLNDILRRPASVKANFKKPGKNAMNTFRAVLISGPPGIGKTTSAHICARMAGFTPIEVNASDSRSKKLVESGININNTSLDGFVTGSVSSVFVYLDSSERRVRHLLLLEWS